MENNKDFLHRQLCRLGEMMGDGLHDEPDGKWIPKEYRKICKALGILPKRKSNPERINVKMAERLKTAICPKCGGSFEQTRSGSLRGKCIGCGGKYQLLKMGKRKG